MPQRRFVQSAAIITAALICFVVFQNQAGASDEIAENFSLTVTSVGSWTVVESPNFQCRCQLTDADARRLAISCELWRDQLQKIWITGAAKSVWSPKCEVCIHPDQRAYNKSLGRSADTSVGSTMIKFDQGRPVLRRIDVRSDAIDWSNSALPHELTHVVLAERFGGHALPRWADEGIAMLSESVEKHRDRLSNLRELLSRRQLLSIDQIVRADRIPNPTSRDAFYGQSVALTSMLIRRSSPARFADFIDDARRDGMAIALKSHYGLDGVSALQTEWDRMVLAPDNVEFISLQLHVGLTPIVAAIGNR